MGKVNLDRETWCIMVKLIFLLFVFGLAYFLTRQVMSAIGPKRCENCDGKGYWRGLRGDRNDCKACNCTGLK